MAEIATNSIPESVMLGSPRWATLAPSTRFLAKLGNFVRRAAIRSSATCRVRRGRLFVQRLQPAATDKILDLGGGRGGYIAGIVPYRSNVTIADADPAMLKDATEVFGFETVRLDGSAKFPIPDGRYDIVFCSSVIEHVTGQRELIPNLVTSEQFAASAQAAQANFAAELRRIAKRYFVQTPHKYFPLESHSFLPFFVVLLPRRWQIALLEFCGRHWIKQAQADFHLLTVKQMRALFPDAEIVLERYCGFVKSIVAIKR
jgi:SAM-dependent methyltransferase